MRDAHECLAKAAELSRLADLTNDAAIRALLLEMALEWTDLSRLAEWQDTFVGRC
jgi:hypothetical protein